MLRYGLIVLLALLVSACSPAFNGRWDGSGETGEAQFFAFTLDLNSAKPTAIFTSGSNAPVVIAVCGLVRQDGHVEFEMDPVAGTRDCALMTSPLTFVGDFGHDVLTGKVLERRQGGGEKLVGVFRAFRMAR
jgi:hypothetical protein